jgi:hypothetical protein
LPATVAIVPAGEILRTRLESERKIFPWASTARPVKRVGKISALLAGPPSPEYPGLLFPATRVSTPVVSNLKTQFEATKYRFPGASVATLRVRVSDAAVPGIGVGGGAPPATVEIMYCWAQATPPRSKKQQTDIVRDIFY